MPALVALVVLLLALLVPAPAAARWVRPVAGAVTRGFDVHGSRFAAGRHRGADFAAPRGAPVRAACTGRVAVAEPIGSSGGVVTIACGPWRVSVLPLAQIAVRTGARVEAGDPVGTAGRSLAHAGVHLGVRRAGRRFGYVDPLRFLAERPPPAAGPARRSPRDEPRASIAGRPAPRAPVATRAIPAPDRVRAAPAIGPGSLALAPWPAWAGLALLLLAVAGRGAWLRRPAGLEPDRGRRAAGTVRAARREGGMMPP
jgi:hypothetical protein